jgi:type I restriction enzyme, S subunit|tara:strand:- start:573 stop:1772 length:1200 start_codon:yes stop_codon:yes gene_type:complete
MFLEMTLGDVVTFQRGFDITKAEQLPGAVPIVSSSGISSYHNKVKATAPGVIIGRKGTLGTVHFMGQDYWPHDTTLWVKDFKGNVPQFVAYFLRTLALENFDTGSSNPTLNRNHIHKIKVLFPKDAGTQRKIAAILTAYDDLIEVNKRRITLLEKMAEELYREWFVRLRFPGYQNTRFVKGVPEGWEVVELKDICYEASKNTKAGHHLSDRLYLPLDSLATKKMLPTDHYDYTAAQSSLALFERGDILFGAMRPYQHKVVVAPFKGVTRTTMFVIRPRDSYLHAYTYLNLFQNSSIEYATLICNGVDRPYVVWKRGMERMKVFLPKEETLLKFEKIVGPILENIHEFYFIQRKLAETRDLLLPRLISGKLSVEDLDIQFPPSMQEGPVEQESPSETRRA